MSWLRCATVREMKEGPSRSVVRCRSQATASCCRLGQEQLQPCRAGPDGAGCGAPADAVGQHRRVRGKLPGCVVVMEACCGAHYLGRQLAAQGHEVRLMSTEYVRPYVKAQKNDDRDAEAIAEAATRPTMRLVALKSEAQLDVQTLHRVRDRLVGQRTALMNQMRSILLDRGIVGPQGRRKLLDALEMLSVQSAGLLSFWLMANIPPSPAVAGSFNGTDRQYWPGLKHLLLLEADRQCCSGARSS